jgi:hypothetical protein
MNRDADPTSGEGSPRSAAFSTSNSAVLTRRRRPPTDPGTPAAAESEGLGALGWILLVLLVVAVTGGWLIWRSRKRSTWDAQAAALEADIRNLTGTQLPPVLTAEDAGQRGPCRGHRCGPPSST